VACRTAIRAFFDVAWKTTCGGLRLVPTAANGQPAFGMYEKSALDGRYLAHSIHVITLGDGGIAAVTMFMDPRLLQAFGLPPVFPQEPVR
jgi:RNA polymerase sigma-70 factor, ECF subfamily